MRRLATWLTGLRRQANSKAHAAVNSGIGAKPTWRHVCSAVHARLCSVAVHPDGVHELWPKLQIRITQLAREGSAPPGLRLPQTKLSRNSNQVARGRIRRFVRHAQPASAVSVTHVQAEKIVATRCPLGNRHDPHCTSTSAPRESATARGAPGVRPVDLAASRMGKGNETSRTDGPIGRAESRRCRRCAF